MTTWCYLVLPGFRFHPTDEELVTFYLRRKVARKQLRFEIIKEMDIYKHEPSDLPKANTVGGDEEWYFFCLRGRKYRNSIRPNRVTGAGFWKATGIDRPIHAGGVCVGLKKSLVYYRGSAGKGTKTEWMMHEFRPPSMPRHRRPLLAVLSRSGGVDHMPDLQEEYDLQEAPAAAGRRQSGHYSRAAARLELYHWLQPRVEYEYMNCMQAPSQGPAAANNVNSGYNGQHFQGLQHGNSAAPAVPQPLPAMAAICASVPSSPAANDDCWDDIVRMVMELTDASVFYDCRY